MKLAGCISAGSGAINEDAAGFCERDGTVRAAWVLDGVTGINTSYLLDVPSEAAWLVATTQRLLGEIVLDASDVMDVLHRLVPRLEIAWQQQLGSRPLPPGYDLPAACLTLAMKVGQNWQALRLGDSYVLSRSGELVNHAFPANELPDLEAELRREASSLRRTANYDFNSLRDTFRRRLLASRDRRNEQGSYSILVPDKSSLAMPQVIDLGLPTEILLCTDGYYRAVDTYDQHTDETLMRASHRPGGVEAVLAEIRAVETADSSC